MAFVVAKGCLVRLPPVLCPGCFPRSAGQEPLVDGIAERPEHAHRVFSTGYHERPGPPVGGLQNPRIRISEIALRLQGNDGVLHRFITLPGSKVLFLARVRAPPRRAAQSEICGRICDRIRQEAPPEGGASVNDDPAHHTLDTRVVVRTVEPAVGVHGRHSRHDGRFAPSTA